MSVAKTVIKLYYDVLSPYTWIAFEASMIFAGNNYCAFINEPDNCSLSYRSCVVTGSDGTSTSNSSHFYYQGLWLEVVGSLF